MDEYVKKQDILDNLEWHDKNCGEITYWGAVDVIEHTIPADVVPVVRCKDCESMVRLDELGDGCECMYCGTYQGDVEPDDFCSRGKRKRR